MVYYGLAAKAGKVVSGADAVEELIIKKKNYLIIIAQDSSSNTKEKFEKMAKEYKIPILIFGDIEHNSKIIGKKNKAIIALKDKNFSEEICRIINGGDTIGQN